MDIILLERVENLGQMGDVVKVKTGYARNFLLPQKKAMRATKDNISFFDGQKAQLEAQNLLKRQEAEDVGEKMAGMTVVLIRSAGDTGQLYGSVTSRDVAEAMVDAGATVGRRQAELERPIKTLGLHPVRVRLHPEVSITVTANVARSNDEAEAQARGEDVLSREDGFEFDDDLELDEDAPDLENLLEDANSDGEDARS
ncbi:MAG: 50S ribosomal protein L9 [Alphaproteobacteria bacterium]|jgi:large subunit ribosomal protein L9